MDCIPEITCDIDFLRKLTIQHQIGMSYCDSIPMVAQDPQIILLARNIKWELEQLGLRMIHMIKGRIDQVVLNSHEAASSFQITEKTVPCIRSNSSLSFDNVKRCNVSTAIEFYSKNYIEADCPDKICNEQSIKHFIWESEAQFVKVLSEHYKRMIQLIKIKMKHCNNPAVYSFLYEILPSYVTKYERLTRLQNGLCVYVSPLLANSKPNPATLCDTSKLPL